MEASQDAPETPRQAMDRAIAKAGGKSALAKALSLDLGRKINRQNISVWKMVPLNWVIPVSRVTGIPQYQLRPDMPEMFTPPKAAIAAKTSMETGKNDEKAAE